MLILTNIGRNPVHIYMCACPTVYVMYAFFLLTVKQASKDATYGGIVILGIGVTGEDSLGAIFPKMYFLSIHGIYGVDMCLPNLAIWRSY